MNDLFKRKIDCFIRSLNGESYRSIADSYGISHQTVRVDVRDIYKFILNTRYAPDKKFVLRELKTNKDYWINELNVKLSVK